MYQKKFSVLVAVITLFALLLCACGAKEPAAPETQAPETTPAVAETPAAGLLELSGSTLTATTWSSPNGATVHLTATPAAYTKGQTAQFVIRLAEEEVKRADCQWDGTAYTASADLNGADGYSYYVVLTGADGSTAEIPVNTPTAPTDETLINMASSLESMCSIIVDSSAYEQNRLTLTGGTVVVMPPAIYNGGQPITWSAGALSLSLDGNEISRTELALPAPGSDGSYALALSQIRFDLPALEDEQQLTIDLHVTFSNGQTLSAPGGVWFFSAGSLMMAVG